MYLCICKAVTDQQIRQAVEQGDRTMGDLGIRFGIGIECGKCVDSVRELLETCLAAPPALALAQPAPESPEAAASAPPKPAPEPAAVEPAPQRAAWFAIDL
ncbi:MAG: (2Fe-2S)-binding protein [Candidatus Competibacteraceae bacterium]|nr:(2Fe-2S)-binding protein [Candidatus Competibacteraceae bacterium]